MKILNRWLLLIGLLSVMLFVVACAPVSVDEEDQATTGQAFKAKKLFSKSSGKDFKCIDDDNLDISKKGDTYKGITKNTDSCVGKAVKEYFCDDKGNIASKLITCQGVETCVDGRCLGEKCGVPLSKDSTTSTMFFANGYKTETLTFVTPYPYCESYQVCHEKVCVLAECVDSDISVDNTYGDNPFISGKVTLYDINYLKVYDVDYKKKSKKIKGVFQDYCKDTKTLQEAVCSQGKQEFKTMECPSNMVCKSGRCEIK